MYVCLYTHICVYTYTYMCKFIYINITLPYKIMESCHLWHTFAYKLYKWQYFIPCYGWVIFMNVYMCIQMCVYTTISSSIHLSMDTWVVFISWLLYTILQ